MKYNEATQDCTARPLLQNAERARPGLFELVSVDIRCFYITEYEAQSADLEKELQDALTSRKELETNSEGKCSLLRQGLAVPCTSPCREVSVSYPFCYYS